MLKKLKLLKKPVAMKFPAKKNAGCPKAPRDFPPRKDGILYPRRVVLAVPSPSQSLCDGRTYGRTDVQTDGHVTITSQPKFLGLIGYQISLAMELRWRALPAGSAIIGRSISAKSKESPLSLPTFAVRCSLLRRIPLNVRAITGKISY